MSHVYVQLLYSELPFCKYRIETSNGIMRVSNASDDREFFNEIIVLPTHGSQQFTLSIFVEDEDEPLIIFEEFPSKRTRLEEGGLTFIISVVQVEEAAEYKARARRHDSAMDALRKKIGILTLAVENALAILQS